MALLIASAEPCTSDFIIIFNSAADLSAKAESCVAKVRGFPPVLVSSALFSLNVFASFFAKINWSSPYLEMACLAFFGFSIAEKRVN